MAGFGSEAFGSLSPVSFGGPDLLAPSPCGPLWDAQPFARTPQPGQPSPPWMFLPAPASAAMASPPQPWPSADKGTGPIAPHLPPSPPAVGVAAGRGGRHAEIRSKDSAGSIVWAKLARYAWWPAQVLSRPVALHAHCHQHHLWKTTGRAKFGSICNCTDTPPPPVSRTFYLSSTS